MPSSGEAYRVLLVMSLMIILGLGIASLILFYTMHCEFEDNGTDEDGLEWHQFLDPANMKYVNVDVGGVKRSFIAYREARKGMKVYGVTSVNFITTVKEYKDAVLTSTETFCAYPEIIARKSRRMKHYLETGQMKLVRLGLEEVSSTISIPTFHDDVYSKDLNDDGGEGNSIVICVPSRMHH